MKKKKRRSFWSSFKLRAQLFRIWFMKNILVWIQVFCISCIIAIFTGNITATTPILGKFIYPIFKPLVDEITAIVQEKSIDGLMDFFAVAISVLISVGIFALKVRNIAQSDIKSEKLKIAMIQANLYFNQDGKLMKKTERLTGKDLDGDGKIGDSTASYFSGGGLFSGISTAVEEFKVIATADLSGSDQDNQEEYEKTLKKAGLKESEKALKDLDKTAREGMGSLVLDKTIGSVDERTKKIKNDTSISQKEKVQKLKFFAKLKVLLQGKKKQRDAELEEKRKEEDILVNRMDKDASVKDETPGLLASIFAPINKKEKEDEKKKAEAEEMRSKVIAERKRQLSNQDAEIAAFLNSIKKK